MKICILTDSQWPSEADAIQDAIAALPFGKAEQERLYAIANPLRKSQSIGALLALQTLCASLTYPICRTATGKPVFDTPNAPQFSLSHTDGIAVAALAETSEGRIGVDFEWLRPLDFDRIAARFFSPTELARYESIPSPEIFFALWTEKEAMAKLSGNGLFGGMQPKRNAANCQHTYLRAGDRIGVLCVVTEYAAATTAISLPPTFEIINL